MSTATLAAAPATEPDAETNEIFDLDIRIARSSSVAPDLAATQGDNCVMTDNCTTSRFCHN